MYQIICTPEYYEGTANAPQQHFLRWSDIFDNSQDFTIAEWNSKEDAQRIIDHRQEGVYYLSHGETCRPAYTITTDCEFHTEDCLPCDGFELGDRWFMVDENIIPAVVKVQLDNMHVQYNYSQAGYDIYSISLEEGGVCYAIVFCPRTLALQINSDDLSGVDWDNAGYFITK